MSSQLPADTPAVQSTPSSWRQQGMDAMYCMVVIAWPGLSGAWLVSAGHQLGYATEEDFLQLHQRLLHNYSCQMRPAVNQSAPLDVSLDFSLMSILDVDDVKQQMSVMATIVVKWLDKNLVWTPADYGGISRMFFTQHQIWSPKVYVESGHNSVILFTLPTQHSVRSDGQVTFTSVGNVQSPCSLDLTSFPYDTQACKFVFTVLDSTVQEISLAVGSNGVTKSPCLVENGEWSVIDTASEASWRGLGEDMSASVSAIVKFSRRSTYYIINIIVPVVAIAMLSLLTFAVPVESGERLTYTLTILLSLSVYMTYMGTIMPMSSVDMPIIFYLLLGLFLISSMCVVLTLLVTALRWSQVVEVKDGAKTLSTFGVRFTITTALKDDDLTWRCCSCQLPGHRKKESPLPAAEAIHPSGSTYAKMRQLDGGRMYTLERPASHPGGQRSLSPLPPTSDDLMGTQSKTSNGEGCHVPTDSGQLAGVSVKSDKCTQDQTTDADILYICNRLNLYSFLGLVVALMSLLSFIFLKLNYQVLSE